MDSEDIAKRGRPRGRGRGRGRGRQPARGNARGAGRGRRPNRILSDSDADSETDVEVSPTASQSSLLANLGSAIEAINEDDVTSSSNKEIEQNMPLPMEQLLRAVINEQIEIKAQTQTQAIDMDISQLEAPTFTTISRGPPEPMLRLKWDHKVSLIGEKVLNPMIHCCDECDKPILVYGRMIPCKHVFCLKCARSSPKICPRCKDKVGRVEQSGLGTVFMCIHEGSRYGNTGCRRTYLSQRDLQAHINHRHVSQMPQQAASSTTVQPSQSIESGVIKSANIEQKQRKLSDSQQEQNPVQQNILSPSLNSLPNQVLSNRIICTSIQETQASLGKVTNQQSQIQQTNAGNTPTSVIHNQSTEMSTYYSSGYNMQQYSTTATYTVPTDQQNIAESNFNCIPSGIIITSQNQEPSSQSGIFYANQSGFGPQFSQMPPPNYQQQAQQQLQRQQPSQQWNQQQYYR